MDLFGLRCSALSVLAVACEAGHLPEQEDIVMKHDLLRVCVESLQEIRAQKHEEFDASTTLELDEVIHLLETCLTDDDDVTVDWQLSIRTLEVLDRCLNAATNLSDLIRAFFDGE